MVYCKDCEYLMFSDFEGECSKAYKGIVNPKDSCPHGIPRKDKKDKTTDLKTKMKNSK